DILRFFAKACDELGQGLLAIAQRAFHIAVEPVKRALNQGGHLFDPLEYSVAGRFEPAGQVEADALEAVIDRTRGGTQLIGKEGIGVFEMMGEFRSGILKPVAGCRGGRFEIAARLSNPRRELVCVLLELTANVERG